MLQDVLSITQVNEYIRTKFDTDPFLCTIAVRGEVSNYKVYPSGHHYFTLKDETASLKCVMFKSSAIRLRFRPDNGMKVIATGKVSVYPRDGAYQLYCTSMTVDGVGDLHIAFEQLKEKLSRMGYFDPAHKKSIPKYPGTIGVVTSAAGAAVHDILRILKKRYPLTQVKIFPVRVQGSEAPAEIAGAICFVNKHRLADLLIVGRGGGSVEDLWAFNDEIVAKAIFDSDIPIISAVGHEPDITISDYVADLRAATPSNGAELAVPDQNSLRQLLDTYAGSLETAAKKQLKAARRHLDILSSNHALRSPVRYIEILRNALAHQHTLLVNAQNRIIHKKREVFLASTAKLDAMSPLKTMTRGYALLQKTDGSVICSVRQAKINDPLRITVSDGVLSANITEIRGNNDE